MAQAKEEGVTVPERGASGYDSPNFAAAKEMARRFRQDAQERRN